MKLNLAKLWGEEFYDYVLYEGNKHDGFDPDDSNHLLAVAIKIIGDTTEIIAGRIIVSGITKPFKGFRDPKGGV
jgi:hypothetical protein